MPGGTAPRVVVVGAGVGGAVAAALLAEAGLDVTILDAHVDPGGCAATFFHRGYRFDAGATLAAGFHPGGPFDRLGRRFRLGWGERRVEPAMAVRLGDGTVIRWGEPDRWRVERRRAFGLGAERFWRVQAKAADFLWAFAERVPAWPVERPADLRHALRAASPAMVWLAPLLPLTVAQLLRLTGAHDPALRHFVDAQLLISAGATAETVPAVYGLVALDLPRRGVYDLPGGIGSIAGRLVGAARTRGAAVRFKRTVTSIELDAVGAVAVHTHRGERVPCDVVVANVTPADLDRLLARAGGPAARDPGGPESDAWGAFVVHAGVSASALPVDMAAHQQVVVDPSRPLGEGNSVFVSVSPAWDPHRAPRGRRAVTISTHTALRQWWGWREQDTSVYDARVSEWTERVIAGAGLALPGLRGGIELALPGTPLTFQCYTRRHLGAVGGVRQTGLFANRSPRTTVPNVWLVGDSIFPGQSTGAVALGAMRVVRDVLASARGRRGAGVRPRARPFSPESCVGAAG